jgi:hypothetical protein
MIDQVTCSKVFCYHCIWISIIKFGPIVGIYIKRREGSHVHPTIIIIEGIEESMH